MATKSKKVDINYIALVFLLYITGVMFGIVENVKSVTFVLIKDTFNASYDFQGYLVSISWYGYVVFCLVSAVVVDKWGSKTGMVCGYVLVGLGCIITSFVSHFVTVILALMVVWMGFGFFEVGNNVIANLLFTENSAVYMNLMHFFYGLGAITGPQIASGFVNWLDDGYQGVYKGLSVIVVILFVILIFTPFSTLKKVSTPTDNESSCGSICSIFKKPYVWLCAFTLGFMEVIEFSASNWGALYYRDVYGFDVTKEGALFVSMFYILFTVSRLFSGFLIEKIGYYVSLFSSLILVIVIYVVGFLCGPHGRWVIPFTGYFIGIMFPTYMCLLMQIFGAESSRISSIVIFISGATNGLVQLLVGYINEYIGNEWGFRCNVLYTLIPLVLLCFVRMQEKKMAKKRKEREVELKEVATKEEKVGDVDSTTIATVTRTEISNEVSSGPVVENSSGPAVENSSGSAVETSPETVTIETTSKPIMEASSEITK